MITTTTKTIVNRLLELTSNDITTLITVSTFLSGNLAFMYLKPTIASNKIISRKISNFTITNSTI